MINPNDIAKALRLIAEEIDSKGYDVILNYSVSCSEYGSVVVVTMRQPSYDINLQFNTNLLKRELINTTEKSDKGAHGN